MTLPETVEYCRNDENEEEDALSDDGEMFGPAKTILRRTKHKISMISNELRLRERRKAVLRICLRKLERIKDSENNLRRSVVIHNTFSRLSNDIKRDKTRGQNRNQLQHQQKQQHYKEMQQKCQKMPKNDKLDLDNLEELCSIGDHGPMYDDPILKDSEDIEQALSRKRKAEVEKAILSYHQLEKRLKSDIIDAFRENHDDLRSLGMQQCNNNSLLNSFACSKAALDSSSSGILQSLVITSLET